LSGDSGPEPGAIESSVDFILFSRSLKDELPIMPALAILDIEPTAREEPRPPIACETMNHIPSAPPPPARNGIYCA